MLVDKGVVMIIFFGLGLDGFMGCVGKRLCID